MSRSCGLHDARTLRAWRERFAAQRAEVKARRGERFCRMWELYLRGSEIAFLCEGLCNFQIQLAKKLDTVPLTRDYIARAETYLCGRVPLEPICALLPNSVGLAAA
jgi:cyclopropane-fatty-acyl-phospholipid synthase